MRVIFIQPKESNAQSWSLPDLIAESLMQKMRQEAILCDENQTRNNQAIPVQAMLNQLHNEPL